MTKPKNAGLTAERARELLSYDPDTGYLTRKIWRPKSPAGSRAGSIYKDGYVLVKIDYRAYYAHRVAWLMVHGKWPEDQLDHINGNKSDNRLSNLREATQSQNNANRRAYKGKGASWHKKRGRWQSSIKLNRKTIYLGEFETQEEARAAYARAAKKYFGQFSSQEENQ